MEFCTEFRVGVLGKTGMQPYTFKHTQYGVCNPDYAKLQPEMNPLSPHMLLSISHPCDVCVCVCV